MAFLSLEGVEGRWFDSYYISTPSMVTIKQSGRRPFRLNVSEQSSNHAASEMLAKVKLYM